MQTINVGKSGADSRRVLEALTPIIGEGAPDFHAEYVGQIYVDTDTPAVYFSVSTKSTPAANDWKVADASAIAVQVAAAVASELATAVPTALATAVPTAVDTELETAVPAALAEATLAFAPLTGTTAPASQAEYVGQLYIDTTAKKTYVAVADDSADPTDDWLELAAAGV